MRGHDDEASAGHILPGEEMTCAASRRCGAGELHGCIVMNPSEGGSVVAGGTFGRRTRASALVLLASAACVAMAGIGAMGGVRRAGGRTELEWMRKYRLEDEVKDPEGVEAMREAREQMTLNGAVSDATHVGGDFKDDKRIGRVLARLTQVAFDTTVELKRSLRGLRGREENLEISGKIDVVDTMLQHLMRQIGVPSLPPPPQTSDLSNLKDAMRLARTLRLMLSKLPPGTDANSMRQVKYNLVVYDLDQISRQLDEIMFKLGENPAYMELQEPAVSQYDEVLGSAMEGVKKAFEVMGDDKRQKQWNDFADQTEAAFQPKWLQKLERYAKENKGAERISDRKDYGHMAHLNEDYKDVMYPKICAEAHNHMQDGDMGILCGHPRPTHERQAAEPVEGGGEVKTPEAAASVDEKKADVDEAKEEKKEPKEDVVAPRAKNEELMDDIIDSAVRQGAEEMKKDCCNHAQAHVAEATAVVSAMRQLILSERRSLEQTQRQKQAQLNAKKAASPQLRDILVGGGLSDPVGTESLLQLPRLGWRKIAAQARLQLLAEGGGKQARTQSLHEESQGDDGGEEMRLGMTRYDEMIERDAVYQASKTAMELEMKDPKSDLALEDAVSVAVQAAIHAEENEADSPVLQDAERAAIMGATKAAKEEETKAQASPKAEDSARELVIAQRVEHAAVAAAIEAARVHQVHRVVHVMMPPAPAGYSLVPQSLSSPQLPVRVQTSFAYSTAPQYAAAQPQYVYAQPNQQVVERLPQQMHYAFAQPQPVVAVPMAVPASALLRPVASPQFEIPQLPVASPQFEIPQLPPLKMPASQAVRDERFVIGAGVGQLNVNSGTFVPDAVQPGGGTVSGTIYVRDGSVDPAVAQY